MALESARRFRAASFAIARKATVSPSTTRSAFSAAAWAISGAYSSQLAWLDFPWGDVESTPADLARGGRGGFRQTYGRSTPRGRAAPIATPVRPGHASPCRARDTSPAHPPSRWNRPRHPADIPARPAEAGPVSFSWPREHPPARVCRDHPARESARWRCGGNVNSLDLSHRTKMIVLPLRSGTACRSSLLADRIGRRDDHRRVARRPAAGSNEKAGRISSRCAAGSQPSGNESAACAATAARAETNRAPSARVNCRDDVMGRILATSRQTR